MERLPWELLDKYFKSQITKSEHQLLESWIAESEEHVLIFQEIESDMKAGLAFPGHFNANTVETWNELKRKWAIPRYVNIPIKKLYRMAAAIMIPLILAGGIGGFFISKGFVKKGANSSFTTIYSPGGQKTKVILPDKSTVWLNARTTLKYSSSFSEIQRNVYIDGEAFFEVKHDSLHPFTVKTSSFNIKVYGTSFNVKAYKDADVSEATLVKGKICIQGIHIAGKKNDEIIIHPNETFKYFKNNIAYNKSGSRETAINDKTAKRDEPIIQIAEKVDVTPIVAWKDGKLCFKNENFSDLAYRLEQWYDVKIHFEDSEVQGIKFTGQFEKENINQVLKYLQMLTPFEYDMKVNEINIRYKK
ncbi:MAG: FecR family protein [Bacteroidota bacterium]|nr:FecR family protein [Bacteroidota bacterium]MDP4289939.1 FecR family protein [Bacteroidota bacterium]